MPKLWFFNGIGAVDKPLLEVPPNVPGLKDWIEARFYLRPGWPDEISTRWNNDGTIDLTLELRFRLRTVDEVTALQAIAKAELNK